MFSSRKEYASPVGTKAVGAACSREHLHRGCNPLPQARVSGRTRTVTHEKCWTRTLQPPAKLDNLTGRGRYPLGFKTAPGEVDLLFAARAKVLLIKLIGKDFFLFAAFRTFADERAQVLEALPARTMLRCRHSSFSLVSLIDNFTGWPRPIHPPFI